MPHHDRGAAICAAGENMHGADADAAIIGDDSEPTVLLTVHTPLTRIVYDGKVARISKSSLAALSHIFESLALLGRRAVRAERPGGPDPHPAAQARTSDSESRRRTDVVWQRTSAVILDM
jgi:hypothetical protein